MRHKLGSWLSNPPEWLGGLIVHALLTIPLTVFFVAFCAYIYMVMWNYLIVWLFSAPVIDFSRSLVFLIVILFLLICKRMTDS